MISTSVTNPHQSDEGCNHDPTFHFDVDLIIMYFPILPNYKIQTTIALSKEFKEEVRSRVIPVQKLHLAQAHFLLRFNEIGKRTHYTRIRCESIPHS